MLIKRKAILHFGNKIKRIKNEKSVKTNDENYQKTHFKAMENIALFKASTMDRKLFKVSSYEDLMQQHNIKESNKIFYKTITTNFRKSEKKIKINFKNALQKKNQKSKKMLNINLNDINNNDKI